MAKPSTLYQAQQAGPKTQTKTEGSFLSYEPSQVFREELIIKNLKPYNIAGINSEPQGTVIYQQSPPDLSATEPLFSLDGTGFPIVFRNESPDNLVVPSSYLAYDIYKSTNPVGNSGSLSNDSYIAKIGAQVLKSSLLETNAFYIKQSISSENSISFKITTPDVNDTFESKLSGTYFPASPIPGDYFLDGLNKRNTDTLGEAINLVAGRSTRLGGVFSGSLTRAITPSQIFLENTNEGQKSLMFANLSYNIYRPAYANSAVGGIAGNLLTTGINNLLDNFGLQLPGAYYVGSSVSEPSFAESPINQTPIDVYGRDTQAIVLGPDVLGKDYEGNESKINFGLKSSAFINQGNLEGDLIWVSPKYKAGNSSFYSTGIDFKPGSILDDTQRLIESADRLQGEARLKHVGNAINQVSRTFNDGYRNITKGSQVQQVTYKNGKAEVGTEYCRIFTKDSPYSTYNRLQKSDGIVNFGRKFTYSVLDSTYNLNIYPTKIVQNTPKPSWLGEGSVKKYMFSIENLAWKDSKRPGFNVQDLPLCERGPNGGRIMWFPPYELKFGDNSTANWQDTQFLGRPEPVYTYKSTLRNGTLSWKIVVDHPSVLNLIVDKVLTNEIDSNADKVLESFFAGCQTYDLYDFAIRYNTVPLNDLQYIQQIISEATPEESLNILNSVTINASESDEPNPASTTITRTETTTPEDFPKNKFIGLGFYFNNDIPKPTETDPSSYETYYSSYYSEKQTFVTNTIDNKESVGQFFEDIIKYNYDKTISGVGDPGLIATIYDFFERKQIKEITINLKGCASASASRDYNNKLAARRIKSVKKFLQNFKISSGSTEISLSKYINNININETVLGENALDVTPKGNSSSPTVAACTTNPVINGQTITGNKSIYLIPSMSCRSVFISDITTTKADPIKKQVTETIPAPAPPVVPPKQDPGPNKQPQVSEPVVETVRTQGLSKKVLRLLLSECNYFQAIEQTNPFLYRSLKEKLKYFEPSFHSTTPEGLNSRITFLNQCLRPGDTIPTIGTDGRPIYNDAINTAFGRPPVLVLRIGDFYNTKIIPRNLQFSYDPLILDMNREGIGVQPMIVGVNLSFDIIGGMGLARPVEDLQNALSFNYYANTEIYDERAVATEDVSSLDAIVEKGILERANEVAAPVVQNKIENAGGTPIGTILSTTNSGDYLVGRIKYKEVIKNLNQELETYFKLVPNTAEQVAKTSNFYVWQYATKNVIYRTGEFANLSAVRIFGKPKDLDKTFDEVFKDAIDKINDSVNPIVFEFELVGYNETVLQVLKQNMISFINDKIKPEFVTNVNQQLQPLNDQQQIIIDLMDKLNLVYNDNDGYIKSDGTPVPYKLSGPSMGDIKADLDSTASDIDAYMTVLFGNKIARDESEQFVLANLTIDDDEISFFTIMCQTFTDKNKLQEFSDYVFPQNSIGTTNTGNRNTPKKFLNDMLGLDLADFFNLSFGESFYDRYRKYKKELEKIPTNFLGGPAIPRKYKTYGNFKLSSLTDDRKVDFTTNVPNAETVKQTLKGLYETVPTEGDKFNGKIF
jgi:outer membrane protein OmpA-like peptidoglycan-associated protein